MAGSDHLGFGRHTIEGRQAVGADVVASGRAGWPPASLIELRESERRFRILSELTNDYRYVARAHEGRLKAEWLTGAFTRITGYHEHPLGPESLWSIVHQGDLAPRRHGAGAGATRRERGARVPHHHPERRHALAARTHARGAREGGELTVYGAARDVTERHLAQIEHESLEAQLRQSQKMDAVGRLAGGVAHDFNNLLTVILTHCGFLLSELPAHTQLHDDASDIQAAARRAAELTQRLLAFSRQQVLTPTVLDLNSVLRDLEPVLTSLVGEGIELEINLHPGAMPAARRSRQLEQTVFNFVVNGRDARCRGASWRSSPRRSTWSSTTCPLARGAPSRDHMWRWAYATPASA